PAPQPSYLSTPDRGAGHYAVDRDFLRELDRDIGHLPIHEGLSADNLGEHESAYNIRAAAASPDYILLDHQDDPAEGRTTPVEPCYLFSRTGALIHVKRNVRSSTLSHLFSQGAVSDELLMTNDTFRSELRNLRQEIETARRQLEPHFVPGLFETISIDPPP